MNQNVLLLSPTHPAPLNLNLNLNPNLNPNLNLAQSANINRGVDKNLIRLNIYSEILRLVEEELNDRRGK
jgi:hypothetical protein